jgi:hypothetical protein
MKTRRLNRSGQPLLQIDRQGIHINEAEFPNLTVLWNVPYAPKLFVYLALCRIGKGRRAIRMGYPWFFSFKI